MGGVGNSSNGQNSGLRVCVTCSIKTSSLKMSTEKISQVLRKPGPLNDLLTKLERKTGVDRIMILGVVSAVLVVSLVVGFAAELVCGVIGFIYPAYQSILALNQKSNEIEKRWLTYWVVFSFFHVIEFFSDHLVWWLPFYWLAKTSFLVWCMAPISSNGSLVIYERVVVPLYKKYHSDIDTALGSASGILGKAAEKAKEGSDNVLEGAKGKIKEVFNGINLKPQ